MSREPDLSRLARELARYSAQRQARQMEAHDDQSRDILRGMAEAAGEPSNELTASFDQKLAALHGAPDLEPFALPEQRHIVHSLRWYVTGLRRMDGDRRAQAMTVKRFLEAATVDLRWDASHTGVYPARDEAEAALLAVTARRPIRFTRVLLGGDFDPGGASFMPGLVDSPKGVREVPEFRQLVQEYPDRKEWPAICTVYLGGCRGGAIAVTDADGLDMAVIREFGDRFLRQPGVRPVGSRQLRVPIQEGRQRPEQTPRRREAGR